MLRFDAWLFGPSGVVHAILAGVRRGSLDFLSKQANAVWRHPPFGAWDIGRATIKRCVNSRGGEYPSGLT